MHRLLALAFILLAACGPSPEQVAREDMLTQMAFWAAEYQTFPNDLEAAQQFAETRSLGAVSLDTRQGSFYPRGSRLPGSLPDWIALNSR